MIHFLASKRCIDNAKADSRGLIWCEVCHRRIGFRVTLTDDVYSVWVEPKFKLFEGEINKKFAHKTGNSSLKDEMKKIVETIKETRVETSICGEELIEERGVLQ